MDIENIKQAVKSGVDVQFSMHSLKRMEERGISREDVISGILTGEIIEDYPLKDVYSEKSLPSCLIMGVNVVGKCIHLVVGFNGIIILIISACYPDKKHWEDDLKTRR